MSGALAERVFAHKLEKVGFTDLTVVGRRPFGIGDAARYPLFTPDVIALMEDLLPPERRDEVAIGVTLTAWKPTDVPRPSLPEHHEPHLRRPCGSPHGRYHASRVEE